MKDRSHLNSQSIFSAEDLAALKKSARAPSKRKISHMDQEKDVIYFKVEENTVNEEKPMLKK